MSEFESLAMEEGLDRHLARHGLDRLIMLSDGVFAIAITLAAIEIHVPEAPSVQSVLATMTTPLLAYFISFIVIAMFWVSNRDLFARLQRIDRTLTALVLAMLCLTALIPASVRITGPGRGSLGGAFQFYAVLMAVSGTLNLVLWVYASVRTGLMSDNVTRKYRIKRVIETTTLPLLFVTIAVLPTVEMLRWMAFVTLGVIALRRVLLALISKRA